MKDDQERMYSSKYIGFIDLRKFTYILESSRNDVHLGKCCKIELIVLDMMVYWNSIIELEV